MNNLNNTSDFILSSDLAEKYRLLPSNYQRLFLKLFREIYNYLLPIRLFTSNGGVLYNYWLVNQLRGKKGLTVRELDLLTLLYNHSSGGRDTVRTDRLKEHFPGFSSRNFISLKQKGFISRHTFDPLAPYYRRCRCNRPIFIRLTPSGIFLIKRIESDLRYALYHTVMSNITSDSKFTQTKIHQEAI